MPTELPERQPEKSPFRELIDAIGVALMVTMWLISVYVPLCYWIPIDLPWSEQIKQYLAGGLW